jgi:NADH:ubiquinone oxidoreductase subunit 3 (subunit A)
MEILTTPPISFLLYLLLVLLLLLLGKKLAGKEHPTAEKSSLYGSGEEAPTSFASPGYRPFFLIAFFFAILHLGVLVIGSGSISPKLVPYILGLILALVALILG